MALASDVLLASKILLGCRAVTTADNLCTISCHHKTYQNYEERGQKLDTFLENKVFKKSKFSKNFIYKTFSPGLIFFTEKK